MDRKSVIVLVISFILLMIWYPLMNRLYPPQPIPQRTNSVPGAVNPIAAGTHAPATVSGVSTSGVQAGALVKSDSPEELVVVENDNVRCTFTSHGGGLKLVELKNYPESVACRVKNGSPTEKVATLNTKALAPAFALIGSEALQGDGNFTLTRTNGGVRAEKTLPSGLRVVKEFRLSQIICLPQPCDWKTPPASQFNCRRRNWWLARPRRLAQATAASRWRWSGTTARKCRV